MRKYIWFTILMVFMIPTVQAQEKGYKGMVNAGWIFLSEDTNVSIEALTIHGYQFNPHLFVGAGVGINYYRSRRNLNENESDAGFIPVFAVVRGYLLKGAVSPYAEAKLGGQIVYNSDKKAESTIYLSPEIGCKFALSDKFAFNVGVEYILHREQDIAHIQSSKDFDIVTGGLCIKAGIEF